jgi:alcohol dehydrogenase
MKINVKFPLGRIVYPGEVFTGEGAISALAYLDGYSYCIITNKSVYKNEYFIEKINRIFKNKKIKIIVLNSGEPEFTELEEYSLELNEFMPDWIIGIGGGSIIDSAKILWIKYENIGIKNEEIIKPFYIKDLGQKSKFVAIPTTAGTGSEVSSSAVCFESKNIKNKKFIVSHELLPHVVILDVNLLKNLSSEVKISGVLDTITHAVEGYVSPYSNDILKDYSIMSIKLVIENWNEYYLENSIKSIQAMLRASHYAGYIQNMAIPGLAHAISHEIARYGIPHGIGCGVTLPYVIKYNSKDKRCNNGYKEIACRLGELNINKIIESILENLSVEMKKNIIELIIKTLRDKEVRNSIISDPTYRANPCSVDFDEFLNIVEA